MFNDIYRDRKVFVTGHTGFKGSWLSLWLKQLDAKVCGYSLEPDTNLSMFKELNLEKEIDKSITGNILDTEKLQYSIKKFQPDIIFHLAAQPLVRLSYSEPKLTYETNVIGSLNMLSAAKNCSSVKAFVNVTTDKCYENKETKNGYKEESPMGGYDMYSSSKACVEILSSSFRRSFLQEENSYALATARAGNVIGGGDWALDRLIPDGIKAINSNKNIEIRNPSSIRPWQHVLEPLSGYLLLGQKLLEEGKRYADGFNFGPDENNVFSVEDIVKKLIQYYGKGQFVVKQSDNLHEAGLLILNIEKAKNILGWAPSYSAEKAISETVDWYKHFYNKDKNMLDFTKEQIKKYEDNINWNKNYAIK